MRRPRVLVLAAALVAAGLSGCGGDTPAGGDPAAATTGPTTTDCPEADASETSTTEGSTTTEPDPRCPGGPSEPAEVSHPELEGVYGFIWTGTVETEFQVLHCDPSTASGTIVLGVLENRRVIGSMTVTSKPYECSPPGGPYSVDARTHETQISGRKTATAFHLNFEGGRPGRLIVRGNVARNTFSENIAGTTSSTTIIVRCILPSGCD